MPPDGFQMPELPELTTAERDAYLARPMTFGTYMRLADQLIRGIDKRINMAIGASIMELQARVRELEARPSISYQGTFQEGQSYLSGDAVTHRGALWIARKDTDVKPGDNGSGFQLAVKRPRGDVNGGHPYA